MKSLISGIFVAVVAMLAMFVLISGYGGKRCMGLAFVGFTNTSERTEALFWFTNSAAADFSRSVKKMSRKGPAGWVAEPPWTNSGPSRYTPVSSAGLPLPGYEDLD